MSTKVVDTARTNQGTSRNQFTLSNGNCMVVVLEGLVVKVYETSSADRTTGWTQRASVSVSSVMTSAAEVSAALFSDNSLGILIKGQDAGTVRLHYFKLTYSGYAASSLEAVTNVGIAGNNLTASDLDISDNGAVSIGFMYHSGGNSYVRLMIRHTGGSWGTLNDTLVASAGTLKAYPSVTLANLGGSASARNLVVVVSTPYISFDGSYVGTPFVLYTTTYNESTGAIVTPTMRANYLSSIGKNSTTGARNAKIFRSIGATNEYHLGFILAGTDGPFSNTHNVYYSRGSWDGTTWTELTPLKGASPWANWGQAGATGSSAITAITMGNFSMVFAVILTDKSAESSPPYCGLSHMVWSSETGSSFTTAFWSDMWLDGKNEVYGVFSSGNRNLATNKHDTLLYKSDNKPYHAMAPTLPVPTAVTPDNGASVPTGSPTLTATTAFLTTYYSPSCWKAEWQISQDPAFATGVRPYEMGITNISGFRVVNGSINTPYVMTQDTIQLYNKPGVVPPYGTPFYPVLTAGAWYIRARIEDTYGNQGAWTTGTRLFTIGHPPTGVPIQPLNNAKFEYGVSGTKSFSWDFSDPSLGDTQTAYQIRIKTGDALGTVIYDSNKVASTVNGASVNIPSANKNQTLYWEVKLWDTDDAAGVFSTGSTFFMMVDPATAAVTAPTANQVFAGATTTLNATVSATAGKSVKQYQYQIYQAGQVVWTSNVTLGTFANGVALPYLLPPGVLENSSAYSVKVTVVDDAGIMSQSAFVNFSTSWTAALSIVTMAVDVSAFNTLGYVRLSWVDANRETGFAGWAIYRKSDIIDPVSGLTLQAGTFAKVYTDYRAFAGTYTWDDYYAPAGHKVSYMVKQIVNRGGFFIESQNTNSVFGITSTDGYWLLAQNISGGIDAYKIPLVTADDFTDEQEEAEYNVIGRGRHVDKGDYLGPKGSLTVQLRDNFSAATTSPTFNGTFDTDITGWSQVGQTILTRDTSVKYAGAASLRLGEFSDTTNGAISASITASPGIEHTVSARVTGVTTIQMTVYWYDSLGIEIRNEQVSVAAVNNTTFVPVSLSTIAPTNAVTMKVKFFMPSTGGGINTYVDSVTIVVSTVTGSNARVRRLTLLAYQKSSAVMYLRNPFGDIFKVNTSGMSVGRLSGVGSSEFCDVTIPYSKVG